MMSKFIALSISSLFIFKPYVIFKGKFNSHALGSFGYVIKILFCKNYTASKWSLSVFKSLFIIII